MSNYFTSTRVAGFEPTIDGLSRKPSGLYPGATLANETTFQAIFH